MRRFSDLGLVTCAALILCAAPGVARAAEGPEGSTPLFNGQDLSGWRGMGHTNPYDIAKWSPEQREQQRKTGDEDMKAHWRVEDGQIINDGHGVFLTTEKDYRDFELFVDWKMMTPCADSGIYLRGSPQVQIWDPDCQRDHKLGGGKGSGALWNNNAPEGKFPLARADRPVGEWNTFHIVMIGNRVSVRFNGLSVVEDAVMENYWDRKRPLPAAGPIQLQTHGGEMRFRNVFVREIPAEEANRRLLARDAEGFRPIFNGKDIDDWVKKTKSYRIADGVLHFGKEYGFLFTKEQYADFVLRFEFKMPAGANNGLAIRSPLDGDPAFVGMELQILDDTSRRHQKIKDYQRHGSIYGVAAAETGYARPIGEWNFQEVVARGPHIQVFLNGSPILDTDVSKIDKTPDERDHPGLQNKEGHIGFMGHGADLQFRNIRLKVLR
ncbi:MAG: hypothetical protein AMXMBFR13_21230 [Phycisphaerae bacterium]